MDVQYSDESYCAICDMYFNTVQQRGEHVSNSPNHPRCEKCDRRFLNGNTLRNHYVYSRHHHYCALCRVSFETAAGLRMHIEYAPVHCDDSDDEDENPSSIIVEGREDELGELQYPDEVEEEEEDDDDSWEHYDDCDFDDEEDLGDIVTYEAPPPTGEEEEDPSRTYTDVFTCPICVCPPKITCATICGHLFCAGCIRQMLEQQGVCPICDEPGTMKQVRRIYLD